MPMERRMEGWTDMDGYPLTERSCCFLSLPFLPWECLLSFYVLSLLMCVSLMCVTQVT